MPGRCRHVLRQSSINILHIVIQIILRSPQRADVIPWLLTVTIEYGQWGGVLRVWLPKEAGYARDKNTDVDASTFWGGISIVIGDCQDPGCLTDSYTEVLGGTFRLHGFPPPASGAAVRLACWVCPPMRPVTRLQFSSKLPKWDGPHSWKG